MRLEKEKNNQRGNVFITVIPTLISPAGGGVGGGSEESHIKNPSSP